MEIQQQDSAAAETRSLGMQRPELRVDSTRDLRRSSDHPPPIAALFLIEFDVKAGYTIVWKMAAPGIDLNGAVEYKSLPSGLHAVSEDLIYFVHEDDNSGEGSSASGTVGGYAGLSAFVNLPTDEADARYARMLAVGVLVPRSYGRLGRAWRHAKALMDMARNIATNRNEADVLETYWRDNASDSPQVSASGVAAEDGDTASNQPQTQTIDSPLASPLVVMAPRQPFTGYGRRALYGQHTRNRSASDGTALVLPPGHRLSPHHPAWSLTSLLNTFGPLIFPIYRAALLRKRILISTHAPVHEVNNFVYNLSVLANIPASVLDVLASSAQSQQRIRPLFTIGVNDIPFLMQDLAARKQAAARFADDDNIGHRGGAHGVAGWVACTTDSILAMKDDLWDVLITMPPDVGRSSGGNANSQRKAWPSVEGPKAVPIKATQRDLRRFRALITGLSKLSGRRESGSVSPIFVAGEIAASQSRSDERKPLLQEDAQLVDAAESIVEPVTWASLAYNGFMWWASAGEQRRAEEADEDIYDSSLLASLASGPEGTPSPHAPRHQQSRQGQSAEAGLAGSGFADGTAADGEPSLAQDGRGAQGGTHAGTDAEEEERARLELAIIAYFHRLTTQMLSVLADIAESSGAEEDDDGEGDDQYCDFHDDDDQEDHTEAGGGPNSGPVGSGYSGQAGFNDGHESDDDDVLASRDHGLVAARRSGLASSGHYGHYDVPNSSATELLLRRRGAGARRGNGGTSSGGKGIFGLLQGQEDGVDRYGQTSGGSSGTSASPSMRVSCDAVSRMGLDVWSATDAAFLRELSWQYLGQRNVQVESKGVEICGLRVC